MSAKIALFGAGGKMGVRLSQNLKGSAFEVRHVEPGEVGQARLRDEVGVACVSVDEALAGVDVVILAVPDSLIGKLAAEISPQLKPGVMVMTLDAAAPFAGHLPARDDLVYFVAHPCHPSIFHPLAHAEGKPDYFGGVAAPQSIVSALMQGPDSAWELGEAIAKTIYQPIASSYRVTVEQMALLEPGLSETVCATLLDVMREAMDEVVARVRALLRRPVQFAADRYESFQSDIHARDHRVTARAAIRALSTRHSLKSSFMPGPCPCICTLVKHDAISDPSGPEG